MRPTSALTLVPRAGLVMRACTGSGCEVHAASGTTLTDTRATTTIVLVLMVVRLGAVKAGAIPPSRVILSGRTGSGGSARAGPESAHDGPQHWAYGVVVGLGVAGVRGVRVAVPVPSLDRGVVDVGVGVFAGFGAAIPFLTRARIFA